MTGFYIERTNPLGQDMRRIGFLVMGLALSASITLPVSAETKMSGGQMDGGSAGAISIEAPWSRANAGTTPGVVYFTLKNEGASDDRLMGASSSIATSAEIHRSRMEKGVMKMSPAAPLAIPVGATVAFQPGGLHVMLMGLERPLQTGDEIGLTLTFEKAGTIDVTVPVQSITATGPADGQGAAGHGKH